MDWRDPAMVNRKQRAELAAETVEILERGTYAVHGRTISMAESLEEVKQKTRLYRPKELEELVGSLPPAETGKTELTVENCTTFAASRKLCDEDPDADPLCLNFASAKNPGGGFLGGSQAQEEALARASGLYACLLTQPEYYEVNRAAATSLYTDHMIYAPHVPVFRDDHDRLLEQPYRASILTAPAVNAGAVRKNERRNVDRIASTMRRRITGMLAVAREHGHVDLVLGAWGCGVFRNDPGHVARWFHEALTGDERFARAFRRVVFAVLDRSDDLATFRAFHGVFGG
jgi:uncharacterized protein (TIGR02452 family)